MALRLGPDDPRCSIEDPSIENSVGAVLLAVI